MNLLHTVEKFQEALLPLVIYALIILFIFTALLLVLYIGSILTHAREVRYLSRRTTEWSDIIKRLANGQLSPKVITLSRRDKRLFRDFLLDEFHKHDTEGNVQLRNSYKQLGFFDQDLRQLKSIWWWKKVGALERLGALEMAEAEGSAFSLLMDKRYEVKCSALRMLSAINSGMLADNLLNIFEDSSRWSYRYVVNKLFTTDIPVDNLKPLAESPNRNFRKAAAILFGKKGNFAVLSLLKNLTDDKIKDVRREAVLSLGRIGLDEAIPLLSSKASDENPQVRAAVAQALGEYKDPQILRVLNRLANDPEFEVRLQAFYTLNRFGHEGKRLIENYRDRYPEMAQEFLSGLDE